MKSELRETLRETCCDLKASESEIERRIRVAIAGGDCVGARDKNGVTPLHFAARFRNVIAARELISAGAEVDAVCSRSGSTPLHRAVSSTGAPGTAGRVVERLGVIRILLESGADRLVVNKAGKIAADYTVDREALELLAASDES